MFENSNSAKTQTLPESVLFKHVKNNKSRICRVWNFTFFRGPLAYLREPTYEGYTPRTFVRQIATSVKEQITSFDIKWATSRENLSSGFPTRWDSNRAA